MATTLSAPPASALTLAEKNFRPAAVEADLYDWWERSGFFTPDESSRKPPFVMMLPPPNVTGDLHLGHALGFGGYGDLSARYQRMKGEPTVYLPCHRPEKMHAGPPGVVVATTRPETIVADVAVAVHPSVERWRPFVGREVLVPEVERRVKIIADEAVDPAFGTGAVKITPGHDATDFEIGQRHGLPVLSVIDKRGMMTPAAGPLAGPDRDVGRTMRLQKLRAAGLLVKEEPITHAIAVHDRCGTVDEPLVMKQWWVRMDRLAPPAIDAIRDGRITILPKYQEKIYFNWMENIRDWSVSRQIWWGHSIPVWYCRDCDNVIVPDEDAPDPTRCTRCRSDDIYQDTDVLDTWFSSGLWPFSTLGWPAETPDLRRYYPGSVLETGYDILFFWVARMIMLGLEHMGGIPFDTVYLHGLVRVGTVKMSK